MDNPVVEVQCEKCEKSFAIRASDYEKAMRDEQLILCDVCFGLLLEEERKANKPIRRCFEYKIILLYPDCKIEHEKLSFAIYGKEGWELIQIINDKAYFKRELLGEAE